MGPSDVSLDSKLADFSTLISIAVLGLKGTGIPVLVLGLEFEKQSSAED